MTLRRVFTVFWGIQCTILAGNGLGAELATPAIQPQSLQRHQQLDELRLRLDQGQEAMQPPSLDLQRPQEFQQFEEQQRQRQLLLNRQQLEQQELHIRQQMNLQSEAGREPVRALQRRYTEERQQQLQRFGWERQLLQYSYQPVFPRLQPGGR